MFRAPESARAPLVGTTFLAPIFCRHISGIIFFINLYYFTIILLFQILIHLKMSLFDKIKNTKKTAWQPNPLAEKALIISW